MGEPKFTEGRWWVPEKPVRYRIARSDDCYEVCWSEDEECVAEVVHGLANAQLMAASKELYEALQAVNKLIAEGAAQGMRYDVDNLGERLFESQQATSAALAKARGEA